MAMGRKLSKAEEARLSALEGFFYHKLRVPPEALALTMTYGIVAVGLILFGVSCHRGEPLAQKNYSLDRLNRVVIISDGNANVGVTDEDIIGQGAALNDGDGIYLVGVGTGNGVNDTLMDAVTDAGRGAYVFLDSTDEAQSIFGPRFDEVMDVAARSVRVELRVSWYMGIQKFHGEEYSTNPRAPAPGPW